MPLFVLKRGGSRNGVNQKRGAQKGLKPISERKRDKVEPVQHRGTFSTCEQMGGWMDEHADGREKHWHRRAKGYFKMPKPKHSQLQEFYKFNITGCLWTSGPHRGHGREGTSPHYRRSDDTGEPVWTSKTKADPLHNSITPHSQTTTTEITFIRQETRTEWTRGDVGASLRHKDLTSRPHRTGELVQTHKAATHTCRDTGLYREVSKWHEAHTSQHYVTFKSHMEEDTSLPMYPGRIMVL